MVLYFNLYLTLLLLKSRLYNRIRGDRMLKNDIVLALAEMDYYKNQSGTVISDVFRVIAEALARGEKVTIRGFGTFEVKMRKGCLVRDIHTREQKQLDDYRVVVFRPGESLKEAVREEDSEKIRISVRADSTQKK